MASIDKAAMIWSVAIVIIGVSLAAIGSSSNNEDNPTMEKIYDDNPTMEKIYDDKKTDSVMPGGMSAIQTENTAQTSIFLQTDKPTYTPNSEIVISGHVDIVLPDIPVTIMIFAPNGELVGIGQLELEEDKSFTTTIPTAAEGLWKQEGQYSIRAVYGEDNFVKKTVTLSSLE